MASLIDLLKQAISTRQNFSEMLNAPQENVRVATTANERTAGLRNQPQGTSMVFPSSSGSFNTVGMNYPIDIKKFNKEGNLVRSYQSVPPGIQNLNMGDDPGTVIETASSYRQGGAAKYQTDGVVEAPYAIDEEYTDEEGNQPYKDAPYQEETNEYLNLFKGETTKSIVKKHKNRKYRKDKLPGETRKEWKIRVSDETGFELSDFQVWQESIHGSNTQTRLPRHQKQVYPMSEHTPSRKGEKAKEEAITYFTNYYESPIFKERVIAQYGEENYEAIKADKIKLLNTIDFHETDGKAYLKELKKQSKMDPEELREYLAAGDPLEHYDTAYYYDEHKATYNFGADKEISNRKFGRYVSGPKTKKDLAAGLVNEITHGTGALEGNQFLIYDPKTDTYKRDPNQVGQLSLMSDYEIELTKKRKDTAAEFGHDSKPDEVKSDIETTRFQLHNEGMYDFNDPDFQFTQEHLDYMRKHPKKI